MSEDNVTDLIPTGFVNVVGTYFDIKEVKSEGQLPQYHAILPECIGYEIDTPVLYKSKESDVLFNRGHYAGHSGYGDHLSIYVFQSGKTSFTTDLRKSVGVCKKISDM